MTIKEGKIMQDKYSQFWEQVSAKLQKVWKDVIQISVYNTGLSEQGNLVVVLKDDSIEEIVKAHHIFKEIKKKDIPTPLIFSPHYIEHSLDSFPLEFLNIQTDYYNLYTINDQFKDLKFDKEYIRLEMERELKSKELLIKMTVLDYFGNNKILKELITVSIRSIEPILKGLLFLLDETIPVNRKELIFKADELTTIDISSLLTAVEYTSGDRKMNNEKLESFFDTFTKQLKDLSDYVERFEHEFKKKL
jgi:hypothetical protein